MSLTAVDFWQRITKCGLALPDQCRLWASQLAQDAGPAAATNLDQVVSFLVSRKLLTQYQVDQLIDQPSPVLSVGAWRILEPVTQAPWQDWFLATHVVDGRPRWIYNLDTTLAEQADLRAAPPSLQLARAHANIESADIVPFDQPIVQPGRVLLSTAPLSGHLLESSPRDWQATLRIVQSLTLGLQKLHEAGIVHGQIRPDRIWDAGNGNIRLLRDPLSPPTSPASNARWGSLLNALPRGQNIWHYSAPEFAVPGQEPSFATDIYSLGCLWVWIATGKPPFANTQPDQLLAKHLSETIDLTSESIGPPALTRVLQHCLAKNPTARFSTPSHLLSALGQAFATDRRTQAAREKLGKNTVTQTDEVGSKTLSLSPTDTVVDRLAKKKETATENKPKSEKSDKSESKPAKAPSAQAPTAQAPSALAPNKPAAAEASVPKATEQPAKPAAVKPTTAKPVAADPAPVALTPTKEPATTASPVDATPVSANPVAAKVTQPTASQAASKPSAPAPSAAPKKNDNVPKADAPKKIEPEKKLEAPTPAQEKPAAPSNAPASKPAVAPVAPAVKPDMAPIAPTAKPNVAPSTPAAAPVAATFAATPVAPLATAATTATVAQPQEPAPQQEAVKKKNPEKKSPEKKSPAKKKSSGTKGSGKKKGSSKRPAWLLPVIGGGSFVIIALIGTILSLLANRTSTGPQGDDQETVIADSGDGSTSGTGSSTSGTPNIPRPAPRDPLEDRYTLVSDDKNLPWAPPSADGPASLAMMPPEAQVLVMLRPANWLKTTRGKELLNVLDTDLKPVVSFLMDRSGLTAEDIRLCVIGMYPGKEGWPEYACRFELVAPKVLKDLKAAWKNPEEQKSKEVTLLTRTDIELSYYIAEQPLTDAQNVNAFVVGPTARMVEAAELQGGTPPLRRQLDQLWKASNAQADLTVIFAPSFLYADGRQIFNNSVPRLRNQLQEILSTGMQGGMLTTTLEPKWYAELRLIGDTDREAPRIAKMMESLLRSTPEATEKWLLNDTVHPFWRPLSLRYPQMLRSMTQQLRVSVEDGQAVANFYLPSEAAPNLSIATWMAINSVGSGAEVKTPSTEPTASLTAEQMLDRNIRVAFEQESLEIALQSIAEAAAEGLPAGTNKLKMELQYTELEKEGITQNQQIRQFSHRDVPLRTVLTDLVKRGNPVVGITDFTVDDQKLIWVLVDDPAAPGTKLVRITTRKAATEGKIAMPKEFAKP